MIQLMVLVFAFFFFFFFKKIRPDGKGEGLKVKVGIGDVNATLRLSRQLDAVTAVCQHSSLSSRKILTLSIRNNLRGYPNPRSLSGIVQNSARAAPLLEACSAWDVCRSLSILVDYSWCLGYNPLFAPCCDRSPPEYWLHSSPRYCVSWFMVSKVSCRRNDPGNACIAYNSLACRACVVRVVVQTRSFKVLA